MASKVFTLAFLATLCLPVLASAQETVAYDATREQLEKRLDSLRAQMSDRGNRSDGSVAPRLLREAQRVQDRLENGDLRTGDVVEITVQGNSRLSGTYRVTEVQTIEVPTLGEIEVDGLLYSEVQQQVRNELGSVVRTPRIKVQPLIRIGVLGSVGEPGFYEMSPAATVSEALMTAGGPTQEAQVQDTRLRRPESSDGEEVQIRSLTGRTLADLGIGRGDEIFVPSSGGGFSLGTVLSVMGAVSSIAFAITRF